MTLYIRRLLSVIIALAATCLLASATYANLNPGATVPGFTLPTLDGKTFALKTGQVVVLDIWASWCPPCRAETAYLITLHRKLPGVTIVGVALDEEKGPVAQFVKKQGIDYAVALDPSGRRLSSSYKIENIPATYVIDKAGVIRYVHSGFPSSKAEQEKEAAALEREARSLASK